MTTTHSILCTLVLGACTHSSTASATFGGETSGADSSTSAGTGGGTLEERQYWQGEMDSMAEHLNDAEKQCGYKLAFHWIDQPTLRAELTKVHGAPWGMCSQIVDEIRSICHDGADAKAAVQAKIKSVACGYANPRTLAFADGTVTLMGNLDQPNFSDWAAPWLKQHI